MSMEGTYLNDTNQIHQIVFINSRISYYNLIMCLFYFSADAHSTQNGGGDYRPNSAKNSGVCSLL